MFAARPLVAAVQTTTLLVYRFDRKILGLSIGHRPRLSYKRNEPNIMR
jgi:hypothetical protein